MIGPQFALHGLEYILLLLLELPLRVFGETLDIGLFDLQLGGFLFARFGAQRRIGRILLQGVDLFLHDVETLLFFLVPILQFLDHLLAFDGILQDQSAG